MFALMNKKTLASWIAMGGVVAISFGYTIFNSFGRTGYRGDRTLIKLYHWDNGGKTETDLVIEVAEEFMKRNPDIFVEVTIVSSYESQFQNFMAASNVPDVFCVPDGNFGQWVDTGVMKNIQEYFDNSTVIDKENIAPSALQRYRWNGLTMGTGDLYAMPKDITPYVMYYNKDLFDQYDVDYPSPDDIMNPYQATAMWRKFGYDLDTVRIKTNGELRIMDDHVYGVAKLYPEGLIWSNGADYLSEDRTEVLIDSPEFIQAFEYIVEAQMKYAVAPTGKVLTSTPEKNLFLNGKAATYIEGRSVTTDLRKRATFNWDIAPIPAFETNQQVNGWSGSVGYGIYSNSEHPDEAYRVAEFFTSKDGQMIMAKAGFTAPLYNDAQTTEEFFAIEEGLKPANTQEFLRAAQHQRPGLWQYLPSIRWKERFDIDSGIMFTDDPSLRATPGQFLPDEKAIIEQIIRDTFPHLFE